MLFRLTQTLGPVNSYSSDTGIWRKGGPCALNTRTYVNLCLGFIGLEQNIHVNGDWLSAKVRTVTSWVLTHWFSEALHRANARSPVRGLGIPKKTTPWACLSAHHSSPEKGKRECQLFQARLCSGTSTVNQNTETRAQRRLQDASLNGLFWDSATALWPQPSYRECSASLASTTSLCKAPEWEQSTWITFPKSNNTIPFIPVVNTSKAS